MCEHQVSNLVFFNHYEVHSKLVRSHPLTSLVHTSGGIQSKGTITSPSPSKAAQVGHKGVNPFTIVLCRTIHCLNGWRCLSTRWTKCCDIWKLFVPSSTLIRPPSLDSMTHPLCIALHLLVFAPFHPLAWASHLLPYPTLILIHRMPVFQAGQAKPICRSIYHCITV